MRKALHDERTFARLLAVFLFLDLLLAAVLAWTVVSETRRPAGRRESIVRKLGEEYEVERQERHAQAVGDAMNGISFLSEVAVRGEWADIALSNDETNGCSVCVTITAMQDETILGQTGMIDPGYCLQEMHIDQELPPGNYPCIAKYSFYSPGDNAYLGTAARQMLLTVEPKE